MVDDREDYEDVAERDPQNVGVDATCIAANVNGEVGGDELEIIGVGRSGRICRPRNGVIGRGHASEGPRDRGMSDESQKRRKAGFQPTLVNFKYNVVNENR